MKRSFTGSAADLNSDLGGESSEDEAIGKSAGDGGGGGGNDSDDDLMATATRLSLRCPLGLVSGVVVGLAAAAAVAVLLSSFTALLSRLVRLLWLCWV